MYQPSTLREWDLRKWFYVVGAGMNVCVYVCASAAVTCPVRAVHISGWYLSGYTNQSLYTGIVLQNVRCRSVAGAIRPRSN